MGSYTEDNRAVMRDRNEISPKKNHLMSAFDRFETVINDKKKKYFDKVQSLLIVWEQLAVFVSDSHSLSLQPVFESLFEQTLRFVLRADWARASVATHTHLSITLQRFITVLVGMKSNYSILHQCRVLESVVRNPWWHPVLSKIFAEEEVDFFDLLEYYQFENGNVIVVRLEMLLEAQCEDMALRLSKSCLQTYHNSEPLELDFNQNELDYITDIYFCTLYKQKMKKELTTEIKLYDLEDGLHLLRRYKKNGGVGKEFNKKCEKVRVWKCSDALIELIADTLMANAVLHDFLIDSDTILQDLISEWAAVHGLKEKQDFSSIALEMIGKLVIIASSSKCIYPFCSFLIENCDNKKILTSYIIRWLIRAMNQNMNEVEQFRVCREYDELKCAYSRLSEGYFMISRLFDDSKNIFRECLLTSFSLTPSRDSLQKLEVFVEHSLAVNEEELSEAILESPNQTVPRSPVVAAPKTDDEPVKQVAPAYYAEVQNLDIDESVKLDLITILRYQRFRTLSWDLEWSELKTNCEKYLEAFVAHGFSYEVELKFLDLDYTQFKDTPFNEEDYIGIEKGYEHCVPDDDKVELENESSDDESSSSSDGSDEDYLSSLKRKKNNRKRAKPAKSRPKVTWRKSSAYENMAEFSNSPGKIKMIVRRKRKLSDDSSDDAEPMKKTKSAMSENQPPNVYDNSSDVESKEVFKMWKQFCCNMESDGQKGCKDVLRICIPRLDNNDVLKTKNDLVNKPAMSPIQGKRLTMRIKVKKDASNEFGGVSLDEFSRGCEVRLKRLKAVRTVVDDNLNEELRSLLNTFETTTNSDPSALSSPSSQMNDSAAVTTESSAPPIKPIILRRQIKEERYRTCSSRQSGKAKKKKKRRRSTFATFEIAKDHSVGSSQLNDPAISCSSSVLSRTTESDSNSLPFDSFPEYVHDEAIDSRTWNANYAPLSSVFDWDPMYTSLSLTPIADSNRTSDV